jgi:hypothetical protein
MSTQYKPVLDENMFQQLLAAAFALQERTNQQLAKEATADHARSMLGVRVETRTLQRLTKSALPTLILLIIIAFLLSLPLRNQPVHLVAEAASKSPTNAASKSIEPDKSAGSKSLATTDITQISQTLLQSSHLLVTDPAVGYMVRALSPFEIKTLQQQAEYGDQNAALVLGMAYEIGRGVPQSCTQAAHWVAMAAAEANAAAQYNLGLRYLYGDGIPPNPLEGKKWLEKAAARSYADAGLALQKLSAPE